MWIAILIVLIAVFAVVLFKIVRPGAGPSDSAGTLPPTPADIPAVAESAAPPYTTEAIENVIADCFRLAFSVQRFDYHIVGEHAEVLELVAKSLDESVHERDYFPRRPMLLPKLLQAINDSDSTRRELVALVLEDPTLAGAVLQRANSAYYRVSPEPVESLDRAVFMLGTDGLRGLIAAAIMQPVFRIPRGSFDKFADVTWEQAERTAIAAEVNARAGGDAEPIVAQLLGLLSLLANIVLFRLTMDKYREYPNLLPRAEVLIHAIRTHRACVASLIAQAWKLSDLSIAAFTEQQQQVSPAHMSSLGRCVYFAELCGAFAMLTARGSYSKNDAQSILVQQGSERETARGMWLAAASVNADR